MCERERERERERRMSAHQPVTIPAHELKGKMTKGKMRIQHVANMNIVFKYLEQTVKVVGIGPQDIVDGNETLVLGTLWSTIVFFMAKDLGGIDDMSALKKQNHTLGEKTHRPLRRYGHEKPDE